MKTSAGWRLCGRRVAVALVLSSALLALPVFAQPNSWIHPITGRWDDISSWSLGVRPDITQDAIMVTNYGQKAIIIDSTTVNNFPSTLTISNLNVAGTSLSTNTVVLNYTGTTHPLRVFNSITVNPNGILLNLFGAIILEGDGNALTISGGIVNQQGGSNYFGGDCFIGTAANYGWYNLTNGTLLMGNAIVDFGGVFNQISGTTSIGSSFVTQQSYNSSVGSGPQSTVAHGALTCDSMFISGAGNFYHGDAAIMVTNNFIVGDLFSRFTASGGTYYLTNGTLTTGTATIGEAADGYFFQYGGIHRTGALYLAGSPTYGSGSYELDGGNLLCAGDETLDIGSDLTQNGGTNRVGGQITLNDAFYTLNGGLLGVSNVLVVGDGALGSGFQPHFVQTNADHYVTNTLTLRSFSTYSLNSGKLAAGIIELDRSDGLPPGFLIHSGGTLTSGGMIFSGGRLIGSGTEMLGTLTLHGADSVDYLSSNSVQYFATSAQIPWDSNVVLQINGWNGSANHIYVGNSSNALTASQLAQIQFVNPVGFPDGNYAAKILNTGEVVPYAPALSTLRSNNALVISWPDNSYTLQFATNVIGPWTNIVNAASPYTNSFTLPQEFFRLVR